MSDVQVQIWCSRPPLHLDFVEETPITLQIEFHHVKQNAADPRKRKTVNGIAEIFALFLKCL